jgi:hypothetical protein
MQKGLGLHVFLEKYRIEGQCLQALYKLRWPMGYICPQRGNTMDCELKNIKYTNSTNVIIK